MGEFPSRGIRRPKWLAVLLAAIACIAYASSESAAESGAPLNDWLIQDVCVDSGDRPITADPYKGCPGGTTERDLRPGELLPYHKIDQLGQQQHDSYPVIDRKNRLLVVNPFDVAPFGAFDQATDGYDLYEIRDGWASAAETRDSGGYETTFFGPGCTPFNGWVFFPETISVTDYSTVGNATIPIAGVHWLQAGQPWPGDCPKMYGRLSQTSWQVLHDFPFGGVNGAPIKKMDAIYSVHGFSTNPRFVSRGHLEIFYFTRQYGATRWEGWHPSVQGVPANTRTCNGAATMVYRGIQFTRRACRDWSNIVLTSRPAPTPSWPIPDLNLLRSHSFALANLSPWTTTISQAHQATSRQRLDTRFARGNTGVHYLVVDCRAGCAPGSAIYQDVPASIAISGHYAFGATIRAEYPEAPVAIRISLSQMDSAGRVLETRSFDKTVSTAGSSRIDPSLSIYRAGTFAAQRTNVQLTPRTAALRFAISPLSKAAFDVIDAWVLPERNSK